MKKSDVTTKVKTAQAAATTAELAERSKSAIVAGGLSMDMMAADAGMGMEGVDKDSYAIPFLAVLQGLSPQCESVEGAKPGKLINTVTNSVYDTVRVVPVAFQRRFLRWVPRAEGGGFKGYLMPSAVEELIRSGSAKEVENDKGKRVLMFEGDELKDTRMHYVLVLREEGGGWMPALMSMASTQIKRSKRWLSQINGIQMRAPSGTLFTPPSFSHSYKVGSEKESNNEGSWYSFVLSDPQAVASAELYAAAKGFHAQVVADKVTISQPVDEHAAGGEGGEKF